MTVILCDRLNCGNCIKENPLDDVGVCGAEKVVLLNGKCDSETILSVMDGEEK